MELKNRYYVTMIGGMTVLVTALHFLPFMKHSPDVIFEELYYVPLLFGALLYGLRGAVATFILASLLYVPFFFGHWNTSLLMTADRVLHIFSTGVFSLLAGYLVDRERRRKKAAERDRYLAGIGQAATTIVHDLKNPLITILGFSRRIQEGKEGAAEAAQAITESALKMQGIVNNVLDFSKPLNLSLREESLGDIVKNACGVCAAKAEEAGVKISFRTDANPAHMEADSLQLERSLVNLITNAVEASGKGQDVSVQVVPGSDSVRVRIRDHGIGMDDETLEHIFTPFFTKKSEGTGLGTAIAKKIVEAHGGRISLQSRPSEGTEVTIDLPVAKQTTEEARS